MKTGFAPVGPMLKDIWQTAATLPERRREPLIISA